MENFMYFTWSWTLTHWYSITLMCFKGHCIVAIFEMCWKSTKPVFLKAFNRIVHHASHSKALSIDSWDVIQKGIAESENWISGEHKLSTQGYVWDTTRDVGYEIAKMSLYLFQFNVSQKKKMISAYRWENNKTCQRSKAGCTGLLSRSSTQWVLKI